MRISSVYYPVYHGDYGHNNNTSYQTPSVKLNLVQNPNIIAFNGLEDEWEKIKPSDTDDSKSSPLSRLYNLFKGAGDKKSGDNKKSILGYFSSLFKKEDVKLSEEDVSFIDSYMKTESEIKEEYDKKISEIQDGFWDSWTNSSEKKRAKLRKEKEEALKVAYKFQDAFEEREKKLIEKTEELYELAHQLNLSKEVLIAFENAHAASIKRLEIINRRKEIMDKKGFSQIGGYQDIKTKLQASFIDKLDDEKAGKYLSEPIPNAILLYGPTGCGKTTFVNALAEETDCNVVKITCMGSQKDKEKQLYNKLEGYTTTDEFGDEVEVPGILEKAQRNFKKTQKRTIVIIDEFDRFFGEGVSNNFINAMKGILESCSEDNHVTFLLTTNRPQKIPYELRNSHRIDPNIPMEPPNRADTVAVMEHYFEGCDTNDLDYNKILAELFKYAPDELYSNTHLKTICETAADEIRPSESPLTTEMILEAINQYNSSTEDHNLLRITKDYLKQFENDKANI